jgi:hypothetical protein
MNALYNVLTNGPLASEIAPHLANGDDGIIYAIVTDKTRFTQPGWVSVASFNTWCAGNNAEYANIEALAANQSSPYFSAARSLLRCLNGAVNAGAIDLTSASVIGLLNVWPFVDTTGATKAALIAYGTYPASLSDLNPSIDFSIPAIAAARTGV